MVEWWAFARELPVSCWCVGRKHAPSYFRNILHACRVSVLHWTTDPGAALNASHSVSRLVGDECSVASTLSTVDCSSLTGQPDTLPTVTHQKRFSVRWSSWVVWVTVLS